MATVTSLGFNIFSRYNGKGVRQAHRDIDSLNSKLGSLGSIGAPIVAASSAAVPAIASITAAAGSMTAGLTAAGAGFASVAAVATPALVDISDAMKLQERAAKGSEQAQKELTQALSEMSPAARTLMKDWQGLTKEYRSWARSLEPDVLPVFSKGIDLVSGNFEKLNPLVRKSSAAFEDLVDDLDSSLDHPFWSEFGRRVTDLAPTAIRSLGRTGGNIGAGVAGVINAFMPSAPGMLQLVEDIGAGFAEWGMNLDGSQQFQDFMSYVRDTGPYVADFFEELGSAATSVAQGLEPIGPLSLQVATGLLELVSAAPPEVLTGIALGITGIGAAVKTAKLASSLTAITNPLGLVITGVGVLAAGLVTAYQESESFRDIVDDAWSTIKDGWDDFWGVAGPQLREWGRILAEELGPELKDLRDIGVDAWNSLNNAAGDFMDGFESDSKDHKGEVKELADAYRDMGEEFEDLSGGKSAYESFMEGLAGVVNDNVITPLEGAQDLLQWIDDFVEEHSGKSVWENIGEGFRLGVADNVIKPLQGAQDLLKWIDNWSADTSGYEGFWDFIGTGFEDLGALIWDSLKFLFHDPGIGGLIWEGLLLVGDAFVWLYDFLVGNSIVPDTVNDILAYFGGLKEDGLDKIEGLKDGVVNSAKNLKEDTLGFLRDFRDGAIDAFDSAQEGIGKTWDKLRSKAAGPVAFVVNSVYQQGIRPVWNAVADKADLGDLPSISMKTSRRGGLARGGILPGDSSYRDGDDQLVPMRQGEGVSVSELMRDPFERDRLLTLNRAAMQGGVAAVRQTRDRIGTGGNPRTPSAANGGGFAQGGLFGGVKDFVRGAKDGFMSGADEFKELAAGGLNPLKGAVRERFGRGEWPDMYNGLVGNAVSGALDELRGVADVFSAGRAGFGSLADVSAGLRRGASFVGETVGRPYDWGGGGPLFDCSGYMAGIENAIRNVNPPSHYGRRYSTFSFQGSNAPPGWVRGLDSPFEVGVNNAGVGHMAGTLLGVNVEAAGSTGTHSGTSARGANASMFRSQYGFAPVAKRRFGGDLAPYESAYVGEAGRELFTAGPTGGYVTPHGADVAREPVEVHLYLHGDDEEQLRRLRKQIRVKGGNVQTVLGSGLGSGRRR